MAPAVGCGRGGPQSGASVGEGAAAHVGQGPLGPVAEAGHAELGAGPARRSGPGRASASSAVLPSRATNGHHVDHADAGVHAVVAREVEAGDRRPRPRPGAPPRRRRVSTLRWWSGSVWTSSRAAPAAPAIASITGAVAALADVDHALEHGTSISDAAGPEEFGPPDVVARRRRGYGELMNLGPPELIIVLVIVLVLFGGAKLPKLAKSLGEAQREFKKGTGRGRGATPPSAPRVPSADKPDDTGTVA